MKRIISLVVTAILTLTVSAQITDGYYRLKCKQTGRYLTIHNDYVNKESAKQTGNVDLQSLETISGFENVVDDPGSIIYLKSIKDGWAIEAQGFTTEGRLNIQMTQVGDAYRLWTTVTSDGMTLTRYLRDYEQAPGYSYITTNSNKSSNWEWYITPVNENEYLGLYGDVKVGSNYYTTFYAAFPIELGSGMKAYAVSSMTNENCTLEDIGSIVPAKTPVVIACAGEETSVNKVTPLKKTDAKVKANRLSGALFCYPVYVGEKERRTNPAWNTVDYDPVTMRVIGEYEGKLCFVLDESLVFIPANGIYLNVSEDAQIIMPTDGSSTGITTTKIQSKTAVKGRFTLQGVSLPDNTEPQRGVIYIEDGQKKVKR